MNLEQQVTSLENSKKLCELGIEQKSLFYWEWASDTCYGIRYIPFSMAPRNTNGFIHYSAFTASEIMYHLPDRIIIPGKEPYEGYRFNLSRSLIVEDDMMVSQTYLINYICDTCPTKGERSFLAIPLLQHNIWDKNLSDALAKALIFIHENGYIKP